MHACQNKVRDEFSLRRPYMLDGLTKMSDDLDRVYQETI